MTRRELILTALATVTQQAQNGKICVEGYIFEQYAKSAQKPLRSVLPDVFSYARAAGFESIELGPQFFTSDLRAQTLSLARLNGLTMPSAYVGGPMHEGQAANGTIAKALEIGRLCAPLGCKAIVNNPDPKAGDARKTDAELSTEAESLNRMGRRLAAQALQLRVHHHTPQLVENAREWRYLLKNTDPEYVHICVDVDWAYQGGFEPIAFLRETGRRLREIHVRSARNKLWLEDLEDSDINYRQVAAYLKQEDLHPLLVVELAYRPATVITRPLQEDLAISRHYAQSIFGI